MSRNPWQHRKETGKGGCMDKQRFSLQMDQGEGGIRVGPVQRKMRHMPGFFLGSQLLEGRGSVSAIFVNSSDQNQYSVSRRCRWMKIEEQALPGWGQASCRETTYGAFNLRIPLRAWAFCLSWVFNPLQPASATLKCDCCSTELKMKNLLEGPIHMEGALARVPSRSGACSRKVTKTWSSF